MNLQDDDVNLVVERRLASLHALLLPQEQRWASLKWCLRFRHHHNATNRNDVRINRLPYDPEATKICPGHHIQGGANIRDRETKQGVDRR